MAGNMDERVVSMRFDNKQFEKNVKTSMGTIDKLKESLDFDESGKSLDEFQGKLKKFGKENVFDDVDKSVNGLKKSIGLLGNSAGSMLGKFAEATKLVAIFDAATAAVRRLESAVKSLTIGPISEGFEKYTTKIGSIKTIANATGLAAEQVNTQLDRLNWFTDETSASFGNMVENIGKFTSVGRGLSESITAMEGIATWGYHSGAGVQEINRAMYNLSQALGTGSVKLMDWKSIENAGMATKEFKEQVIEAAVAAGTLKKKGDKLFAGNQQVTTANFNATLAKGWFTSDVLMSVLNEYGGFADKLNKYMKDHPIYDTAAEAMEAMDKERAEEQEKIYSEYLDKLSAKTEKSTDKIKKELQDIVAITDLDKRKKEIKSFAKTYGISVDEATKLIDRLAACEESLGEKAFKSSQQSKSFRDALEATKDAVSTGWMNTFQIIFGGLEKSIELWTDVTDILWDLFASGASLRNNALVHWADEFLGRDDLFGPDGILHTVADSIMAIKEAIGTGFKDVFFPDLDDWLGADITDLDRRTGAKNGLFTTDQIINYREGNYFGARIKEITGHIKDFGLTLKEFFTNEENVERIRAIARGVFSVVQLVGDAIGGVLKTIGDFVTKSGIAKDVLDFFARVGDKIKEFVDRIRNSGFITTFFEKVGNTLTWFYQLIKGWIDQIGEFFEETGIGPAIRGFFNTILEFFIGGENDVNEQGEKTESGFFRAFGWVQNVKDWLSSLNIKEFLMSIFDIIKNFGMIWNTFIQALNGTQVNKNQVKQGGVSDRLAGILESVSSFGTKLSGVFNWFKGIFEKITGWLESIGVLPWIRDTWNNIKDFFANIGLIWDVLVKGKKVDPKDLDKKQINIINVVANFGKKIKRVFEKVKGWFTTAWTWIVSKWNLFKDWLESSGILPWIRNTWNTIKTIIANIGLVWRTFVQGVNGTQVTKDQFKQGGISDNLAGILEGVSSFGGKIHSLVEWIKDKWNKFTEWLESSGILPWIRDTWGKIKEWFGKMTLGPNGEESTGILDSIKNFFVNLWEGIKRFFSGEDGGPVAKIKEFFSSGIFATIGGWFTGEDGIFAKIGNFFRRLFGGDGTENIEEYTTPLGAVGEKVSELTEGKGGFFSGIFEKIKTAFTTDGKLDLSKGFLISISEVMKFAGKLLGEGLNALNEGLAGVDISNITKLVGQVMGLVASLMWAKAITGMFSAIKSIAKKGKDKTFLEQFTDLLKALGDALLKIGIAVALVAGSMKLISSIDKERFDAVTNVMLWIGGFIGGLIIVTALLNAVLPNKDKLPDTFKSIGNMILEIGVAITLIVASIWLLSKMAKADGGFTDQMWTAIIAVAAIMGAMLLVVAAIAWITKKVGVADVAMGIATFAGMAILLAAVTICIMLLQKIGDMGKAAISAALLAGVLLAMAVAMKIMNKIKVEGKTLATLALMSLIIIAISATFILLQNADGENLMKIAGAFAIVLVGLATAMLMIAHIPAVGLLKGAAALAGALLILSGAIAGIALLASTVAERMTDALVTVMANLAAASNSASLVDIEQIKNVLALMEDIAVAFGRNLAVNSGPSLTLAGDAWSVFNKLSNASSSAEAINIAQIHAIIGEDGKGGLLQDIQTAFSGITETGGNARILGSRLQYFGECLQALNVSGEALQTTEGTTSGIQTVKDKLGEIEEIIGIATSLGGEAVEGAKQLDLYDVGTAIGHIAGALRLYDIAVKKMAEEVSGQMITEEDIQPISGQAISKALESVMAALPNSTMDGEQRAAIESWASLGGKEGEKTNFAIGLVNVADAMTAFTVAAKDFDSGSVENAIGSLETLKSITETVDKPSDYKSTMDGVSEWEVGDKDNGFAHVIIGLGNAMTEFGKAAKELPFGSVRKATNVLQTFAAIYKELTTNDELVQMMTDTGKQKLVEFAAALTKEDPEETFTKFGEGISKLGSALATFSGHVTKEEYDPDKVATAVGVLHDLGTLQKTLQEVDVKGDLFTKLIFGENGIDKLGDNMATIGSRLKTFSDQLKGFDIDVEGKEWTNISTVLTYLSGLWIDLNGMADQTQIVDDNGVTTGYLWSAGYKLTDLSDGIKALTEALAYFHNEMVAVRATAGTEGENKQVSTLGEFEMSKWENLKSVLETFKQISIDMHNAGLKNNEFYDLADFGSNLSSMFYYLDKGISGTGDSDFVSFMNKIAMEGSTIDTGAFTNFTEGIRVLAEATGSLHDADVDDADVQHISTLLQQLMSINTDGMTADRFNLDGVLMATNFVSGFISALTKTSEGESDTIDTAFINLLAMIAAHSADFYAKGLVNGQQYAAGFKAGLGDLSNSTGPWSQVVSMDVNGKTSSTEIKEYLDRMEISYNEKMSAVITHLEALNNHFGEPIVVNDKHDDLVFLINQTNTRLNTINKNIGVVSDKVGNLKIVLDSGTLVGGIAPKMNRMLGQIGNKGILAGGSGP